MLRAPNSWEAWYSKEQRCSAVTTQRWLLRRPVAKRKRNVFVFNSLWTQHIDAASGLRLGRQTALTGQATLLVDPTGHYQSHGPRLGRTTTSATQAVGGDILSARRGKARASRNSESRGPVRQTRRASRPLTYTMAHSNQHCPGLIQGRGVSLLEFGHLVGFWNFIAALEYSLDLKLLLYTKSPPFNNNSSQYPPCFLSSWQPLRQACFHPHSAEEKFRSQNGQLAQSATAAQWQREDPNLVSPAEASRFWLGRHSL